jgi:hypothetical protein
MFSFTHQTSLFQKNKKNSPKASVFYFFGGPEARRTLSTSITRKELYQIYWGESNLELGIG